MSKKDLEQRNNSQSKKKYQVKEPIIRTLNELDFSATYSYASYLSWKFKERVELFKGKVLQMSAPSVNHQRLLGFIQGEIYQYLKNQSCEVFAAPFDVRFSDESKSNSEVFTVLQPDVCVICDSTKLDKRGCIGAPDIVVEILSSSTQKKDLEYKFDIYEEYGVREYWVVDPEKLTFLKYVLNSEGKFIGGIPYDGGSQFISDILPGFKINVDEFFGVMRFEKHFEKY